MLSKVKSYLWEHRGKIGVVLGAGAGALVEGTKWEPIYLKILQVLGAAS